MATTTWVAPHTDRAAAVLATLQRLGFAPLEGFQQRGGSGLVNEVPLPPMQLEGFAERRRRIGSSAGQSQRLGKTQESVRVKL